jgi:hypothetical protein
VVAVPPADKATAVLLNWPLTLTELGSEPDMSTVPVYPPVDVSVMVEVPLFPGDGDDIVILVAVTVIPGLDTVTCVVPEEVALKLSPPYVAVMVSVPAAKPSDAVAAETLKTPVAVLPDPSVTCLTVPMVTPPVVNVTGPVSVPAVAPVIVAVSVTADPNANVVGLAVTAVVVAAVPDATTVIATVELVDPV